MKKTFLSLVLTSSVIVSSCLSAPLVSAEADTEQIKTLLEGFVEQNYKGDACINGYEDGVVEVIFLDRPVGAPKLDTNAIYSEFDKFFKDNNIDSSKVFVEFLEDSPVISDDTLITDQEQIKTLLAGYIEQNYKGDACINGYENGVVEVIFLDRPVGAPKLDTNAIYSEFDKFFKDNNIDSSKVDVMFLEDSPVIPTSEKLGDINFDGKIDTTDLTELSLALIGDKDLTEDQQKAADLDKDGKAALSDLARMRQYISKIITSLD